MADTQTSVAINIGSQRISMAVFEASKNGGLILKGYDSESIVADPAMDASRINQTRIAIGDLAKRLKVQKLKARYAISGQAVFTRFVKLPPLQDDNIEQLVTFEAQQHVPFPLAEVIWDYELLQGSGSEKEAVIVAIKSEELDEINLAVNDSGLGTVEVDVSPMALYNAYRSSYGTPEEPTLIIDVGAKTSNLIYLEGNRFFTRSIALGGTAVTAAIAKEYQVSFAEAEKQKLANGLVALGGGHTEQLDEAVAALAMIIRNALTRLPAEIARTTNYYRSQHGGNAPKQVLLAGGGANLPYALEFFQEKLNLPVSFFNPVRQISLGKGVDPEIIQREAHLMGELIGLGLRGVGSSTINIDLVPGVVELARAADRRKPFLIGAAALLLAGVATWSAMQFVAANKAEDLTRTMVETREDLEPIATEINALLRQEARLREIATAYTSAESDHAFWLDLLGELSGAFASDVVWLTNLEPLRAYDPLGTDAKTAGGTPAIRTDFATTPYGISVLNPSDLTAPINAIRITGMWRSNPKRQNIVSELLNHLKENTTSFSFEFQGTPLKDEQIIKRNMVAGEAGDLAFPFEMILPLAREISIP